MAGASVLLTVVGRDSPGIAARLFRALEPFGATVVDVEQVQVHGRLLLCVEIAPAPATDGANGFEDPEALLAVLGDQDQLRRDGLSLSVTPLGDGVERTRGPRHQVTVLGARLGPPALSAVFGCVAAVGANVDRIVRLAAYPVTSYELTVSGGDPAQLRRDLNVAAARLGIDVAVQAAGLHRRAKHLIVLDADSTLLQGEVIDQLAARTGHLAQVTAITAAAMAGEMDFADALRERVALLAGTPAWVLDEVRHDLRLAPGARTLVRTLRRLGYVTAVVSGGFVQVIAPLASELGIDHLAANVLEIDAGCLTGRLTGPLVDRAGKATALIRFAELAGVPMARTIAVGDGANDLDMLGAAGLGIAFNAKPVVREAADTSLSVPYLDAVLFMLGISRSEIESADSALDTA